MRNNEMNMTPMPPLNSTLTITGFYNPEAGFRFENQTVYTPDGRAIKLVIEENERVQMRRKMRPGFLRREVLHSHIGRSPTEYCLFWHNR